MKNIACTAFCALFFLLCLFFAAGAFLPGNAPAAEGRELASFPTLTVDGAFNDAFFLEFDAWLTDHFTFRSALISLHSRMKESVFTTGSEKVIVGKDDCLFLAETAADYSGESAMCDADIIATADALLALSQKAEEAGARFLFLCAPNKNTVYPEYMPATYQRSEEASNLDRLLAELAVRGVLFADVRDVFRGSDTMLYHKRDTHWNSAGAMLATDSLLQTLALPHADNAAIPSMDYKNLALKPTRDFPGDLDEMLYPGEGRLDENLMPDYDFTAEYIYTSNFRTPMDMIITTRGKGESNLLMFRDSFGSAMLPYLASAFAQATFERATPYRTEQIAKTAADVVIVEIAERNLPVLLDQLTNT